ncbi:MAG TPA: nuclear transport factor 2 family protein [Streptosporangiaceae bacterium]|nr:nuclear transport factor 2 family protein [Streptosporangiaceae bacterium]
MAHPNEDLLRRGYQAFATDDIDTVLSLFAEDIVWHVTGTSQLSGDYRGHQEVVGFFGRMMELSGGTFRLDIHDVLANDVHGTVLVTAHAERDDQKMDVRQVNIWHLANGKATEFWSFAEDQAAMDNFFA